MGFKFAGGRIDTFYGTGFLRDWQCRRFVKYSFVGFLSYLKKYSLVVTVSCVVGSM